jgi:hypothetical protein
MTDYTVTDTLAASRTGDERESANAVTPQFDHLVPATNRWRTIAPTSFNEARTIMADIAAGQGVTRPVRTR